MNTTARVAFLKNANNKLGSAHAAAGEILDRASTPAQLAENLEAIKALEAAVAELRRVAESV